MKIIDRTPFYKENGELGLMDRGRAIMKFGSRWIKEVEAQKSVISVLGKVLDKRYTLLRNITPPGLDTMIPFILVGPTGVYVMIVYPVKGMFSARGDQWGDISAGTLRPVKPNLLNRTERMARAVQIFLQRQDYSELINVDAVLLCSDSGTIVDCVRPILRVVMRDALERFAASITQARVVLDSESVLDIVKRLLNPPAPPEPKPIEIAAADAVRVAPSAPAIAGDEADSIPGSADMAVTPDLLIQLPQPPADSPQIKPPVRRRLGMTDRQWAILIGMFIIWVVLIIIFIILVLKDQNLLNLVH